MVSSASATTHLWSSPLPYLFGGLALMLILIATALIILACSHKKSSSTQDEEKGLARPPVIQPLDMEPKVVVIMPGDNSPSFVATPAMLQASVPPTICCVCDQAE